MRDAAGPAGRRPAIFLSAGEVSGDHHAAAVAREIRARDPTIRLFGLGGPEMAREGVELLADLDRLAVMGTREVLPRLPFFFRLRQRIRRLIRDEEVHLVLLVDYPGFNLPLAKWSHRRGRRVLYFIAPQVWAWKKRRTKLLARYCDRVLSILPFETEWLEARGVDVEFVGHPLLDSVEPRPEPRDGGLVGIFPGSRRQEVQRILPIFAEAARRLGARRPDLGFLVARPDHLPPSLYAPHGIETGLAPDVRRRAFAAMTKSGTITLELALAEVPMVVGYRTRPLTYAIARRLVNVPFIALANLVAGEGVVPELIQNDLTPESVVDRLEPLLGANASRRAAMIEGLQRVRERLGEPGCASRVADRVLASIR